MTKACGRGTSGEPSGHRRTTPDAAARRPTRLSARDPRARRAHPTREGRQPSPWPALLKSAPGFTHHPHLFEHELIAHQHGRVTLDLLQTLLHDGHAGAQNQLATERRHLSEAQRRIGVQPRLIAELIETIDRIGLTCGIADIGRLEAGARLATAGALPVLALGLSLVRVPWATCRLLLLCLALAFASLVFLLLVAAGGGSLLLLLLLRRLGLALPVLFGLVAAEVAGLAPRIVVTLAGIVLLFALAASAVVLPLFAIRLIAGIDIRFGVGLSARSLFSLALFVTAFGVL
jgi:hypothetical protein